MILAVEHQNLSVADLGPYVSGGTLGLINYANTDANCINSVFNKFLEYMPYIMLGQTLLLIITEKFTFRIPRIAQRVERFYKVIKQLHKLEKLSSGYSKIMKFAFWLPKLILSQLKLKIDSEYLVY